MNKRNRNWFNSCFVETWRGRKLNEQQINFPCRKLNLRLHIERFPLLFLMWFQRISPHRRDRIRVWCESHAGCDTSNEITFRNFFLLKLFAFSVLIESTAGNHFRANKTFREVKASAWGRRLSISFQIWHRARFLGASCVGGSDYLLVVHVVIRFMNWKELSINFENRWRLTLMVVR